MALSSALEITIKSVVIILPPILYYTTVLSVNAIQTLPRLPQVAMQISNFIKYYKSNTRT